MSEEDRAVLIDEVRYMASVGSAARKLADESENMLDEIEQLKADFDKLVKETTYYLKSHEVGCELRALHGRCGKCATCHVYEALEPSAKKETTK